MHVHLRRMNIFKPIYYAIGAFFVVVVFSALLGSPNSILASHEADTNTVESNVQNKDVIAVMPKVFPPYYSVDKNGAPYGFAIDMMEEVAKIAGLNVEYRVEETWSDVLDVIRTGEVDIIPNLGMTDERDRFVDFTIPMETFAVSIFVRRESEGINVVDDLLGKQVAVVEDNIATTLLQDQGIDLVILYDPVSAFFELVSGNVDALVYPEPIIKQIARQVGLSDKIRITRDPLIEIKRGIAVQEGDIVLQQRLDTALKAFLQTKTYQEIYSKWFGTEPVYWSVERVISFAGIIIATLLISMFIWRYISIAKLNKQLSQFAKLAIGREEKMIELKKQIKKQHK